MRRLLSNLWYRIEHWYLDLIEAPETRALRARLRAQARKDVDQRNWEDRRR